LRKKKKKKKRSENILFSFDCYGTLIDWENGIYNALKIVFERHGIEVEREGILKLYSQIEPELEKEYKPYKVILKMAAERIFDVYGIEATDEEKEVLVRSIYTWKPFNDVKESLVEIKRYGKIAVISNTDEDIIKASIENMGIDFDFVVTAEKVKAYKPSLKVFEFAYKMFGVDKSEWIHVGQSVFHDIVPAKKFGLKTVLIKRRGFGATPEVRERADFEFGELSTFSKSIHEIV